MYLNYLLQYEKNNYTVKARHGSLIFIGVVYFKAYNQFYSTIIPYYLELTRQHMEILYLWVKNTGY